MGQRNRMFAEIWGCRGWIVKEVFFEGSEKQRWPLSGGAGLLHGMRLVIRVERRWAPRCSGCGRICSASAHEKLAPRRWEDLSWAGRPVQIEAALIRVKCGFCGGRVEMTAWAEPRQRQSRRLQQRLALEAASMPVLHVAAMHGLSWSTVRRAEAAALDRWDAGRPVRAYQQLGVDEKWLGRRHGLKHKFVTIVSNLETGEPVWIGPGRGEATLATFLASLSPEQKTALRLFAMDMHAPFKAAIRADPDLAHVAVVHDPFHVVKRAGQAIDELRREAFFRTSPGLRAIGRGRRWLLLRAWERTSEKQRGLLKELFAYNPKLARAYQMVEELRMALRAPDRPTMEVGLRRILRRTQEKRSKPLRGLHDCLRSHWNEILALGEHHPPTGRIEALNNNWETLVRRGRGYRDHAYLLRKLRFMTANPIRTRKQVLRFLALGIQPPMNHAA